MKTALLITTLSVMANAQCDIPIAIQSIRPGAEWSLSGNTYAGLNWLDDVQTQPSKQEVIDAITACQTAKITRDNLKTLAKALLKNGNGTPQQKADAIILLLDLDQ